MGPGLEPLIGLLRFVRNLGVLSILGLTYYIKTTQEFTEAGRS